MKKSIQVALLMLVVFLIPFSMASGIKIPEVMSFFLVATITITSLLFFRNDMMQVLVMLVFLVLIHKVLIYRTYVADIVPFEIGIIFVVISYLKNKFTMKPKMKIKNNVLLLILGFIIFAALSSTTSFLNGFESRGEIIAFQIYIVWAVIFLLYGIQIRQFSSFSQIKIERAFAIVTIGVSFLHMFALVSGTNLEVIRSDAEGAGNYFRYGGVFSNVNIQSAFLVGGMAYGMFLYSRKSSTIDKLLGATAFVLALSSNLISGSRMSLVACTLLVFMFMFYQRKRIRELMHFFVGTSILTVVLVITRKQELRRFFKKSARRIDAKGTDDQRLSIWDCTLDLLPSNPLGMGIDYQQFSHKVANCIGEGLGNPHNIIMDFAVHMGIPGLFILFTSLFFLLRKFSKIMFKGVKDEYASNIFFLTIVFVFGMSEAFIFSLQKLHLIYFFVVGLTLGGIGLVRDIKVSSYSSPNNITMRKNNFVGLRKV